MKTDSRTAVMLLALDALVFEDQISGEWGADKQIRHLREQIALARKHLESDPAEALQKMQAKVERLHDEQDRKDSEYCKHVTELDKKISQIEHQRDKALADAEQWSVAHDKLEAILQGVNTTDYRFSVEQLAAHDAGVIERALSDDKVREAMQVIWNDHTSDTGCFPDDFSIDDDGLLYFTAGHYFADRVANQLRQPAQEVGL